eukprot:c18890_g1_i1.p1 GENE.c18890_g1_i1~~c18890_g1_i1.p1  ORF type:complete len:319 (-),score=118.44 c18890_g1_i1:112-1068(-)
MGEYAHQEGLETYKHQVAGHGGILTHPGDGTVLKPAIPKEMSLYQNVHSKQEHVLTPFIPIFHGVTRIGDEVENPNQCAEKPIPHQYIVLEDLFHDFMNPSILDIKMGTKLYSETADPQKKERAIRKARESTSGKLGFRVCGLQVYHPNSCEYFKKDKEFGRTLIESNICDAFRFFIFDGTKINYQIIPFFISSLENLLKAISQLDGYRFISSSLLLFYDSNPENKTGKPKIGVRMIDFGKSNISISKKGPDSGFIFGLENIIKYLYKVQEESHLRSDDEKMEEIGRLEKSELFFSSKYKNKNDMSSSSCDNNSNNNK